MDTLYPIPDYADLMPFEEFRQCCDSTAFTNDDGSGYYATATEMSRVPVDCRELKEKEGFTHVAWFNK